MSEDNDYDLKCKIVLIGESGVGKTCIISRYVEQKFDPNEQATYNASFSTKIVNINNKSIELNLWDTVGQERFRSFTNIFFINAKIVVLVYDVTNRRSFEEIKKYWYQKVKEKTTKDVDKFIIYLLFFYNYSYRSRSE